MVHDFAIKALYNAARRYCIDQMDKLTAEHIQKQGVGAPETPEIGLSTMLVNAILEEIERVVPQDFAREAEVREYLLLAGKLARVLNYRTEGTGAQWHLVYYEPDWTETERIALEKAQADYASYIAGLSVEQAAETDTVLFRHVMSDTKRLRVRKKLAERWDVDDRRCWFPLRGLEIPTNVLAFQDAWFRKEVGAEQLQNILVSKGITRVWEINEIGLDPEYEVDPRLCDFAYPPEKYWSSPELNWLVYVSHESSITFAGDWLVNRIQEAWPNWEERVYTGWEYERPLNGQ